MTTEPEFITAVPVDIKRQKEKDYYMPFYQTDVYGERNEQWFNGALCDNLEDAIKSHTYDRQLRTLKIFKITLPVKEIPDSIKT